MKLSLMKIVVQANITLLGLLLTVQTLRETQALLSTIV